MKFKMQSLTVGFLKIKLAGIRPIGSRVTSNRGFNSGVGRSKVMPVDALDVYEMTARQSVQQGPEIGWLYRKNVKIIHMDEEAEDDRLLIAIERTEKSVSLLSLTFDSWLLSFEGPYSPADRVY